MNDLLVIVPTRGRPDAIPDFLDAWRQTTFFAHLLFALDRDDPELGAYLTNLRAVRVNAPDGSDITGRMTADGRPFVDWTIGPRLRLAGTLNRQARDEAAHYRAIGFMGDDHRPRTTGWDEQITVALDQLGTGIAYGNDLYQGERLPTAAFMTSDIIRALGRMVPPGPMHLYLDNYWLDLGRGTDRIRYLPDVVIEHMHPAADKAEWDERYAEVNDPGQYDADWAAYEAFKNSGGLAKDIAAVRDISAWQ